MENLARKIAEDNGFELVRKLSCNAFLCKKEALFVVLKLGDRVTFERNSKARLVLEHLKTHPFPSTLTPHFVALSDEGEIAYMITSYVEAAEVPWSEFNGDDSLGGVQVSLKYVTNVTTALADLRSYDTAGVPLKIFPDSFEMVLTRVNYFVETNLVSREQCEKITEFIKKNGDNYFSAGIIISNGDFYPRNLLVTSEGQSCLIDWDGAHLAPKEQVAMYFWCSMFGNKGFQKELLNWCQKQHDWSKIRYTLGLFLAATEDLSGWAKNPKCTAAVTAYTGYLNNFEDLFAGYKK